MPRRVSAKNYREANAINLRETGRGLSQQAWGIIPKIKQVNDAITSDCQQWAYEVHPEVSFWALNQRRPMKHNKKTKGVPQRGLPFCVEFSYKLKDTLQTDRLAPERTICWTLRRQLGQRCGRTKGKQNAFVRQKSMNRDWGLPSTINK